MSDMRNLKLLIEYDGTDFAGWQVQPEQRTVQGELYGALAELGGPDIKITGAGRTDAGVHAAGQVANALLETKYGCDVLHRALNAKLPRDVRVRRVEEAPLSFNARFDARSRTYSYIFIRKATALWRRYYLAVEEDIDVGAMRGAAAKLKGRKDFASFASAGDNPSTICRMIEAQMIETGPLLTLTLKADHFLYHMVRTVAGTLLEIGKGKPLDMDAIIAACDRRQAGPTLAPQALYLMRVEY